MTRLIYLAGLILLVGFFLAMRAPVPGIHSGGTAPRMILLSKSA